MQTRPTAVLAVLLYFLIPALICSCQTGGRTSTLAVPASAPVASIPAVPATTSSATSAAATPLNVGSTTPEAMGWALPVSALDWSAYGPASVYHGVSQAEWLSAGQVQLAVYDAGAGRAGKIMADLNGAAPAITAINAPIATPQKIAGQADGAAWSPDGQELAIMQPGQTGAGTAAARIFDRQGRLLSEFAIQPGTELRWLTNQILISVSRANNAYYDRRSGQYLFQWTELPNINGIWHQPPLASPDGRWIFTDEGLGLCEICPLKGKQAVISKEYSLYDIDTLTRLPLLHQPGHYLGFAGWSRDNSTLYLISRPQTALASGDPAAPFGLLAYHTATGAFELLFPNAVQAIWNTERSRAVLVYPDPAAAGLAASIWDAETRDLSGLAPIANTLYYRDPAIDALFPHSSDRIRVVWAHDGRRAALSDAQGRLSLLDATGGLQALTTGASGPDGLEQLLWSPDDRYLLVACNDHAWAADLSALVEE